jgi:hypothetical protein
VWSEECRVPEFQKKRARKESAEWKVKNAGRGISEEWMKGKVAVMKSAHR